MGSLEFVFGLIFLGSVGGTVRMVVNGLAGGGKKALAAELRAAEERARLLEGQLVDARLQNDQLEKQLEWHTKLLETQDRVVKQLAEVSPRLA